MEFQVIWGSLSKKKTLMCIKILIPIYKIISHISNFFSDKSNHNKIYDNYLFFLNKMNDQTLTKKPIVTII
jgi:hypothetical protein